MIELNDHEQKLGSLWFFLVTPIALLFIFFLARVDLALTYSETEATHAASMHELRMAQTSLSSVSLDDRNAATRTSNRGTRAKVGKRKKH